MCGRFALACPKPTIEKFFNVDIPFDFPQRFNIAPTQQSLVLCGIDKLPLMMHWGFLPFWAKDKKIKEQINAKCETIYEKPMFRNAFKEHRCIVVASGFFEWKTEEIGGKQSKSPYYIYRDDNQPMILAGIWDRSENEGVTHVGFTILTTHANSMVSKFHTRMPVILQYQKMDLWLDNKTNMTEIKRLFKPADSQRFYIKPVSKIVNSPKNDIPECLSELIQ